MSGNASAETQNRRVGDLKPVNGRVVIRVTVYESLDPALFNKLMTIKSPYEKSAFVCRALSRGLTMDAGSRIPQNSVSSPTTRTSASHVSPITLLPEAGNDIYSALDNLLAFDGKLV